MKKDVDIYYGRCYYTQAPSVTETQCERQTEYARVVELADSLDSGSSVHSGRAGSSPASRTNSSSSSEFEEFFYIQSSILSEIIDDCEKQGMRGPRGQTVK